MKRMTWILGLAVGMGVRSMAVEIVTNTLAANYAADFSANGVWENRAGGPAELDLQVWGPTVWLDTRPMTLLNVDSWWTFGTSTNANSMIVTNSGTPVKNTWPEILGGALDTKDMTLEMWFDPAASGTNAMRQILYEVGGGTGISLTYDQGVLRWRMAGNLFPTVDAVLTNFNGVDLTAGNRLIQAVAMVDFDATAANRTMTLYVNGQFAGAVTNFANTDWDGGDGQGIGGRAEANLGGYGNGFNFPGPVSGSGNYSSFQGNLAIVRFYSNTVLSAAEVLQNYKAVSPDGNAVAFTAGTGNETLAWETAANWTNGVLPTADETAYVMNVGTGTDIVTLSSTQTVQNVMIGRGGSGGTGQLTVNAGGDLSVARNLWIGDDDTAAGVGILQMSAGSVTVSNNIVFGPLGRAGGTINVNSGSTLTVSNIIERALDVNQAQFHINGGTVNVLGTEITVQSFRLGQDQGTTGEFTLRADQVLTNTGTFFLGGDGGTGNNSQGYFTNNGGRVFIMNAMNLTQKGSGQVAHYVQASGHTAVVGGAVDVGKFGDGNLILNGGVFEFSGSGNLRFGQNGGTGTLTIDGGTFVMRDTGDVNVGTGTGTINLNAGTLDFQNTAAARTITFFNHGDGATNWFTLHNNDTGFIPLNVLDTATMAATTVAGGSVFEIRMDAFADAGSAVTWIGGAAEWDATASRWADTNGVNVTPDLGANAISNGQSFAVILATNNPIVNQANSSIGATAAAGWGLSFPNSSTISVQRTGASLGFGPAKALITNSTDVVTRLSDLVIQPVTGAVASAARLEVGGGATLTMPGAGTDLILGGTAQGQVDQNGGTVAIGGQLVFGDAGTEGGTYNLNAGTLIVSNGVIEGPAGGPQNANVNNAQLMINGGDLQVLAGDIYVQRFSVGEVAGTTGRYTVAGGQLLQTSGTLAVGAYGEGSIMLTGGVINASDSRIGQYATGTGVFTVAEGQLVAGTIYLGDGGMGTLLLLGGTNHTASNVQIGQNAGSEGLLRVELADEAETFTVSGNRLTVGNNGKGTLELFKGTVNANTGVYAGDNSGSSGSNAARIVIGKVDQSTSPTLNVKGGNLDVGIGGLTGGGERTQAAVEMYSGAYNQLNNNLVLGQANSDGTFTQHGGSVVISNQIRINNAANSVGLYVQNGGTATVFGVMDMGNNATAVRGEYRALGGMLDAMADVVVGNLGGTNTLVVNGGTVRIGGTLTNAYAAGATGVVVLAGGTLDMTGGDIVFGAGAGEFKFTGGLLKDVGTFGGTLTQEGGALQIGASPGVMTVSGDYSLEAGAELRLELAAQGATAGTDFDLMNVAGNATLAGVILITDVSGGAIDTGIPFTWDVLKAETIDLTGSTVTTPSGVYYRVLPDNEGTVDALQLYTIPEPGSLAVFGAAAVVLLLRRRMARG